MDINFRKFTSLFIIIFLLMQRIAIPIQNKQIPLALFLVYAFLVLCIINNKAKIEIHRFIYFIISITLLILASIFSQNNISYFSLFYLIAMYAPFVFVSNVSNEDYEMILDSFQNFMAVISVVGILQILLQFAGISHFDLFNILPTEFVQKGYNTSYPLIAYGTLIHNSNGIIFLESSFFSQYLAVSLIIEIIYFKKIWRIALYIVAILTTFAGTGLLLLVILSPFWMSYVIQNKKTRTFFFIGLISLILITAFTSSFFIDYNYYLIRMKEFGAEGSSAHIRFIAPYLVMWKILNTDAFLGGMGAGAATELSDVYSANFPVIPKLLIEYGVIAGTIFTLFLLICFFHKKRTFTLTFSAAVMFFVLSGSLLQPQSVYLLYLLVIFFPEMEYKFDPKRREYKKLPR